MYGVIIWNKGLKSMCCMLTFQTNNCPTRRDVSDYVQWVHLLAHLGQHCLMTLVVFGKSINWRQFPTIVLNEVTLANAFCPSHTLLQERATSNHFDKNTFSSLESTWKKMMSHFEFHAQCIIRFAKRVPGETPSHAVEWHNRHTLFDSVLLLKCFRFIVTWWCLK